VLRLSRHGQSKWAAELCGNMSKIGSSVKLRKGTMARALAETLMKGIRVPVKVGIVFILWCDLLSIRREQEEKEWAARSVC
jgi:hypothetical protein